MNRRQGNGIVVRQGQRGLVGNYCECREESGRDLQDGHRWDRKGSQERYNGGAVCQQAADDGPILGRTVFGECCASKGSERRSSR